jgi:hypothetical protein
MRRLIVLFFVFLCLLFHSHAQVMTKTVGLDPAVCAPTNVIQVFTDTAVTYCYFIQNTDDVTYTMHDLVDDQLGTILSGFMFSLTPGTSVWLTQTANISADTTNVATWTLSVPGGPTVTTTATATVTTQPLQQAPIPTLSEWGVILLGVFLLGIGVLTLRRQNSHSSV